MTAVTTMICTTLDLQTYPHPPFLIVPSCFILTNILPILPLAPKLWKEREEIKKNKIPCKPVVGSVLQTHVRRNEGLDLTGPCLLFFSLTARWGNNGNWTAASLEGSLAFSESQVGALSHTARGCCDLCTAASALPVPGGADSCFAMSCFQENVLETVLETLLASMGFLSPWHKHTKQHK